MITARRETSYHGNVSANGKISIGNLHFIPSPLKKCNFYADGVAANSAENPAKIAGWMRLLG
jgi:hypothetical protein